MRIELPAASWDHAALRADEDAHTLTLASHRATEWMPMAPWNTNPGEALRVQVPDAEPMTVTLTF
jgi:homoaconitase/3-isopropylmalate dehydratase large subunit